MRTSSIFLRFRFVLLCTSTNPQTRIPLSTPAWYSCATTPSTGCVAAVVLQGVRGVGAKTSSGLGEGARAHARTRARAHARTRARAHARTHRYKGSWKRGHADSQNRGREGTRMETAWGQHTKGEFDKMWTFGCAFTSHTLVCRRSSARWRRRTSNPGASMTSSIPCPPLGFSCNA